VRLSDDPGGAELQRERELKTREISSRSMCVCAREMRSCALPGQPVESALTAALRRARERKSREQALHWSGKPLFLQGMIHAGFVFEDTVKRDLEAMGFHVNQLDQLRALDGGAA
jgi:hypothetical protein